MPMKDRTGWCKRVLRTRENARIRPWLTDRSSLTERLRALGAFSLTRLSQHQAWPTREEARVLRLKPKQLARSREVVLLCNGQPVVFAHTILPRQPRGPLTRWLARLGNRSLGSRLFSHPGFLRGPLTACRIDRRHPLYLRALNALRLTDATSPTLWARRSRFTFGKQNVLVTEIFSPDLPRFFSTSAD
jgi:chorismate--pyruvate lyase